MGLLKRDLAALGVVAFVVWRSLQAERSLSFTPAWSFALDEDLQGGLPFPLVADLNGDGRKEALRKLATPLHISAHSAPRHRSSSPRPTRSCWFWSSRCTGTRGALTVCSRFARLSLTHCSGGFAPARLLSSASLLPASVRVASGRRAAALAVGHADFAQQPPRRNASSPLPPRLRRKQVILVVTPGFAVLAFDHNLALLWQHVLADDFPVGWSAHGCVASVSPVALQVGDRGAALVAFSARPPRPPGVAGDYGGDPLDGSDEAAQSVRRAGFAVEETGDSLESGPTLGVSVYAFEAATGARRWARPRGGVTRDGSSGAVDASSASAFAALSPQHDYRLDAAAVAARAAAEATRGGGCRAWREGVLSQTPHSYSGLYDGYIALAEWHPARSGGIATTAGGAALPGGGAARAAVPATNGASSLFARAVAAAAGSPPRSIDPRLAGNLQSVAASASGAGAQPLGAPQPPSLPSTHAFRPNSVAIHSQHGIVAVGATDGRVLCAARLEGGALHADLDGDGVIDHARLAGCVLAASAGLAQGEERLWSTPSLCGGRGSGGGSDDALGFAPLAPLPLRRPSSRSKSAHDLLALSSDGVLTRVGGSGGARRWGVRTAASWDHYDAFDGGGGNEARGGAAGGDSFVPTLAVLRLRGGSASPVVLACGARACVLVAPDPGSPVSSFALPFPPTAPVAAVQLRTGRRGRGGGGGEAPVLRAALLVRSRTSLHAFEQSGAPAAAPLAFLLAVAAIVCAAVAAAHAASVGGGGWGGGALGRARRSTDGGGWDTKRSE